MQATELPVACCAQLERPFMTLDTYLHGRFSATRHLFLRVYIYDNFSLWIYPETLIFMFSVPLAQAPTASPNSSLFHMSDSGGAAFTRRIFHKYWNQIDGTGRDRGQMRTDRRKCRFKRDRYWENKRVIGRRGFFPRVRDKVRVRATEQIIT
ncbi:hypothetical protein K458DRAFT_22601 [Lentithecium fluviatile CBS 122367]|uniref:Uncharacterized protein n=1 Tax=Lentithecium fluviatile CBS 122367 TaxID=1168545 RepID=A0A6G1J4G8_9PLEO|nr:hypothetical protein K458DRAFT_22601 [Lentithecium fluviatile CBS 122367]